MKQIEKAGYCVKEFRDWKLDSTEISCFGNKNDRRSFILPEK